jgi:uncharacterized protein
MSMRYLFGFVALFLTTTAAGERSIDDDGKPVQATFAGASAQGTFAVIGEALTEMVRREYPGSSLGYEPGSNASALVSLLGEQVEFSFLSAILAKSAEAGEEPFQNKLEVYPRVGTIFPPVTMVYYVIVRNDFLDKNDVRSFEEIRRKKLPVRISLNQKGNIEVYHGARAILEADGITESDIESWGGEIFYVPSATYTDMMKDGKLDMVITAGYYPDRRIAEMQQATAVTLLPISASSLRTVAERFDLEATIIPKSAYNFLESDYPTLSLRLWVVAGPAATNIEVFKVTKAIYKNIDYFRTIHPMFKEFSAKLMVDHGPFRLHPGAAAFYRQIGHLPHDGE